MRLIKNLGAIKKKDNSNNRSSYGIYECPCCFNEFTTRISDVKNGSSTKCKSCAMKKARTKHGDSHTRLYNIWCGAKARCENPKDYNYPEYGGRGISMCEKWADNYTSFREWALSNNYEDSLTLDREDGSLGYSPSNCRWATSSTQAQNITQFRKNNTSGYKGVCWSKTFKKYIAYINVDKKRKHLGYFKNPKDGAKAYNAYIIANKLNHTLNIIGD